MGTPSFPHCGTDRSSAYVLEMLLRCPPNYIDPNNFQRYSTLSSAKLAK